MALRNETLREKWESAKRKLDALGFQTKKLFNKGLGPALDAYERAFKSYENIPGTDPVKQDKARKAKNQAAVTAGDIIDKYGKEINGLERLSNIPAPKSAFKETSMTLVQIKKALEIGLRT